MRLPLLNRLKKQAHKDMALLQDEIVEIVYEIAPKAVLHGGTAIWRCYAGNRFSEDLDFYLESGEKIGEELKQKATAKGFVVEKFKATKNSVFAKIASENSEIRLEIALRETKKTVARAFERLDGSSIMVFTLSEQELLLEKASAFQNRKLARDIYDVFFLSQFVPEEKETKQKMKEFLKKAERPLDEKNLKAIVFAGAIPSFEQMIEAIKRRFGT
jgi:predicted nucleotidyltransferase component of viral defense system